ncbi:MULTISPECIES: hypothetical protein [Alteromonas]|jgi:hypothetical protein|uniref:Uncharacterized protein n=1 Tax=Alteromonas macleodii TaxID=28108 RepID=A0A6T9XZY0_ALTMA|nr:MULTISPECIES: hypothetical protein [Alteromonas]MEC8639979.1 hypothetical protein [Pseudomonadota bacterium]MBC6985114.1 hypothetical protein [Alteromonas sp. BZK5]MEC8967245.1 hypothetical protein [Pseudomonadota bacterium]MEC9163705.1 hypothetical protein [Pseudomonadota bacterium]MEC9335243.1 hypothetical protein [Pseudomonadota bacterium]|tara:strand:- start:603 stop:914 length:312 start_codon:yes stop_codon:yes gene_type:complete
MISEADWKHFKQVKADALDKCCQQVLDDVRKGIDDPELSNHAKYLYLYKLMENSDKRIVNIFDYNARSKAMLQLALMKSDGLLEAKQISGFSDELQSFINSRD